MNIMNTGAARRTGCPRANGCRKYGMTDVAEDMARNKKLSEEERPAIAELLQYSTDVKG